MKALLGSLSRKTSCYFFIAAVFMHIDVLAQQQISGKVMDQESAFGVPGATVQIKGSTVGTITDINGEFTLEASSDDVLVISFVGYLSQEVAVGNQTNIEIILPYDIQSLEEIVVVGYGQTQNIATVSTSLQKLAPSVIEDRPIARPEQAIQGSAPSVIVLKESGSPGAPLTIRMRGVGTAGNATPLILLNGVQVPDMNFINPSDIGNITILKDAAASAIYGARGGNGVILIETKKGDKKSGPTLNFSGYYGVQSLASEGEYLTPQEYAQYYNNSIDYLIREGLSTLGGRGKFSEEEIATFPEESWIRRISDTAPISDYHLSLTGGDDATQYYFSGGIFSQDGIIGNTSFDRRSFSFSLNSSPTDRINLSTSMSFSNTQRAFIAENSENSRLMNSVASLPPIFPMYDEIGQPFNNGLRTGISHQGVAFNPQPEFGNPILGLTYADNQSSSSILFGNALASYEIIDGLKLNATLGIMTNDQDIRNFGARFEIPDQQFFNEINSLTETRNATSYSQAESYISYELPGKGDHQLDAFVGASFLENTFENTSRFGLNFFPNTIDEVNFTNIISNDDKIINPDYSEKNTTLSFFGRVNYNFREKYLVSATFRADGSSKFSVANKWGYFPSVALGWVASEEDFLQNIQVISLFKVRGSWGVNGNDRIAPYQYVNRYQRDGAGSLFQLDFNETVKWEEISQTNVGVDANLWEDKVGVTLDYYVKTTTDMLLNFPNPSFLGLPPPVRNAASVRNEGLELLLLYRNSISDDLDFRIGLNGGLSRNEITDLGGGLPIEGAGTRVFAGAPSLSRSDVGHPIASFYGFEYIGLDEAGNPQYKDQNGDGEITMADDRTFIGNPYPTLLYGMDMTVNYRRFDFTMFWSGTAGNDLVNASTGYHVQYSNRTRDVLDAWSLENPNSEIMRPSALEVTNHEFSSYYVEDGGYLRLRNFTVGYKLPANLLNAIGLSAFRAFVSGNNLFTFTKYSGYDPEIGANNDPLDVGIDRGFYPISRSFTAGFQLTF